MILNFKVFTATCLKQNHLKLSVRKIKSNVLVGQAERCLQKRGRKNTLWSDKNKQDHLAVSISKPQTKLFYMPTLMGGMSIFSDVSPIRN